MKMRSDFVTNSSSSSFVLTICNHDKSAEGILGELAEHFSVLCWKEPLIKLQQGRIDDLVKVQEEYQKSSAKDKAKLSWLHGYDEEVLKEYKAKLKELKACKNDTDIFLWLLEDHGLTVDQKYKNALKISGGISMFNSSADIPDIVRNIITYLAINYPNTSWHFHNSED